MMTVIFDLYGFTCEFFNVSGCDQVYNFDSIQNLRDCLVIENESKASNAVSHPKHCDINMKHIRADRCPIGYLTLSRKILDF